MCNTLKWRGHASASAGRAKSLGLTFESATDTLSQHRANFLSGRFDPRKCCLLYIKLTMKTPAQSGDGGQTVAATVTAPQPLEGERLAWLALTMTTGLGPTRIWRAVNSTGTAQGVMGLPLTQLEGLRFPAVSAQSIASGKSLAEAEKEWSLVQQGGGTLVTPADEEYPERLREIFDPPTLLWLRGDKTSADSAGNCDRRDASSDAVWNGNGRDVGARSGGPWAGHFKRHGARRRHGRASRSARIARKNCSGLGNRNRRDLSQGEQAAGGTDS